MPALAAGSPVTVNATVAQTLTISGLTSTISFGTVTPGTPATVTGAESYTVSSNDPAGYSLTLTPPSGGITDTSSDVIPNSDIYLMESVNGAAKNKLTFVASNPLTLYSKTTSGGDTFAEDWTLTAPAVTPAGTYSGVFTYTATGN
jgi:hypothetical protein